MRRSVTLSFDFVLFGATFLLILVGVLFIYSSGVNSSGLSVSREYLKQLIWAGTGISILLLFAFLNYGTLRLLSVYLYAISLILLLVTLAVGRDVNGHRSWLGVGELGIQPSEFAKLSCILFLATYFSNIGNGVRELPRLLLGVFITMVPLGLILLQPDLGTTLVLVLIFLFMAFMAGAQLRHVFFIFLVGALTIILAALPSILQRTGHGPALLGMMREPSSLLYLIPPGAVVAGLSLMGFRASRRIYFYWIFYFAGLIMVAAVCSIAVRLALKDYQIMRFVIFLNPHLDPQGSGWNILQSLTAIGSGGFHGKGFLHGTQSHYQFLPSQSTDFIFSIITEEWGFLGRPSRAGSLPHRAAPWPGHRVEPENGFLRPPGRRGHPFHAFSAHADQCGDGHGHHARYGHTPPLPLLWRVLPLGGPCLHRNSYEPSQEKTQVPCRMREAE